LLEELPMRDARSLGQQVGPVRRGVADAVASYEQVAAMEAAGELINRKWKLAILFLLAQAPHRYNALLRMMPGVTPKMLTQQLRALEDAGVVEHIHGPGRAKHTEYRLTSVGDDLRPTLDTLASFAFEHARVPGRGAPPNVPTLRRAG
jgi:DNA-binding HxlR family transcriptional regulator